MAPYSKSSGVGGAWIDKSKVAAGTRAKIITEAVPAEEMYEGKMRTRNVVKLRLETETEPKNFDLNKPNINGLIEAFGEDSKEWINKPLTVHTEKVIIAGKRGTSMYLVPEGFEVGEDAGGYVVIQRVNGSTAAEPDPLASEFTEEDEIDPSEIPF